MKKNAVDKSYVIRKSIRKEDIKGIRELLDMTQKEFALFTGVSKRTVEHWESTDGEITGPIVTLIELLGRKPELAQSLELPEKKLKLRLFYIYKNMICTLIDVDEPARKILIRNYIDQCTDHVFVYVK